MASFKDFSIRFMVRYVKVPTKLRYYHVDWVFDLFAKLRCACSARGRSRMTSNMRRYAPTSSLEI